MSHSDYISKHGGKIVDELLTNMERTADTYWSDIHKFIEIVHCGLIFSMKVWKLYKESKKL